MEVGGRAAGTGGTALQTEASAAAGGPPDCTFKKCHSLLRAVAAVRMCRGPRPRPTRPLAPPAPPMPRGGLQPSFRGDSGLSSLGARTPLSPPASGIALSPTELAIPSFPPRTSPFPLNRPGIFPDCPLPTPRLLPKSSMEALPFSSRFVDSGLPA